MIPEGVSFRRKMNFPNGRQCAMIMLLSLTFLALLVETQVNPV